MEASQPQDDEMGVNVGDTTIHNYPTPATPATAPAGMSTLAKVAVGAALVLSGGTAGVAIPYMLGLFNKAAPAVQAAAPAVNNGLKYVLDLPDATPAQPAQPTK